ncbi:MAG: NADH-quinone oxidoreductase subunit N, partial [Propionibacteriales bacterium]|nr:NADH-quinone oxidoreductase subunit N [Propionibacteriales bacterium]
MPAVQPVDWVAIGPPLVLAVAAVLVLVVDAFVGRSRVPWANLLSVFAVLGAGAAVIPLAGEERAAFCLPGGLESLPACSYVVDDLTFGFWVVVLVGTLVTVLLSAVGAIDGRVPSGEHHFLLLCSATGALTIAAARDLATLVVALELVSLPAFALVGLKRGDRRSAEAALKFFLVSVVSTAVMLYGISL